MSSVGRKRKPAHIHVLHGNPGKRKINKNEPKPKIPKEVPKPPKDVGLNVIGRREWKRVAKSLYNLKLLTDIDITNLLGYCLSYQHWITSNKKLKRDGLMVIGKDGVCRQSAYVYLAEKK